MDKKFTIKEKIFAFLAEKGIKKTDFFESTGIQSANFKGKNMQSQLGGDMIVKILTTYPELSPEWLLTDRGEMLKTNGTSSDTPPHNQPCHSDKGTKNNPSVQGKSPKIVTQSPHPSHSPQQGNGSVSIPLVSPTVAAGFGNENFAIAEADVKDYYTIPRFRHTHIDFMIEVTGDSMTPHLNSGDIIACAIVRDSQFIQWNKCHVIATVEQGLLVKRLMPGTDSDHLRAVSDNTRYPPFDIPKSEITGLALVIGSVCLE